MRGMKSVPCVGCGRGNPLPKPKHLTGTPPYDTLVLTRLHKTVRHLPQGWRTFPALSVGATRQRLDMGVSRERDPATCERRAYCSEARICMRARARRLVVLLVSIETPFRTSVERWNDGRTPRHSCGGVSDKQVIFMSVQ